MPFDHYSPCPGGSGKKVKFCCADLVTDLEKIHRMLDGDQRLGCLDYIEKLEKKYAGRACLVTIKATLERSLGRTAEAEQTLQVLLSEQTANPVALAEAALVALKDKGLEASLALLQQSLEASTPPLHNRVAAAVGTMAQVLLGSGFPAAARAYLVVYLDANAEDQQAMNLLMQLDRSADVPLLLKQDRRLEPCPAGAAWKAEYNAALALARRGAWKAAVGKFAALAEQSPDSPTLVRNQAILHLWLADNEASAAAWRAYSKLNVSEDDAVEAESLSQLLGADLAQDVVDLLVVEYRIADIERLLAALASSRRAVKIALETAAVEGEPPPKAAYTLLDRPQPTSAAGLTLDTIPLSIGNVEVYGRQTDREARLELLVARNAELEAGKALVAELAGDAIEFPGVEKVVGSDPVLNDILDRGWVLPPDVSPDQVFEWTADHRRRTLLEAIPPLPLALLDGKTLAAAAADPAYRVRVLGVILQIELGHQQSRAEFDFNELRQRLGLPPAAPISPKAVSLDTLPLPRLARVDLSQASDEELYRVHARAIATMAVEALRKSSLEIVSRPSLDDKVDKAGVYRALADVSEDSRKSVEYIGRARDVTVSAGRSSAPWDLIEVSLHLRRREFDKGFEVLQHVISDHINEPGVRPAVRSYLQALGFIDEQGRPIQQQAPAGAMAGPAGARAPAQAEPGKIWTPGSESEQVGEKKSALWVPGMD